MTVVNAHAHIGDSRVFDVDVSEDDLLREMDRRGIDASIVMPFAGAADYPAVHDRIAALAARLPGRIFGQIQLDPHMEPSAFRREAQRCARELGFVGMKLHPLGCAVNPLGRDAAVVYETAGAFDLPVMIHTGAGVPWALPSLVIPVARRYPGVRFILAHAGMQIYAKEAWVAAAECPNIWLECSWCTAADIRFFVTQLGAARVMWGGDVLSNYATELSKYDAMGLSDEERAQCLGLTAIAVYRLPITT